MVAECAEHACRGAAPHADRHLAGRDVGRVHVIDRPALQWHGALHVRRAQGRPAEVADAGAGHGPRGAAARRREAACAAPGRGGGRGAAATRAAPRGCSAALMWAATAAMVGWSKVSVAGSSRPNLAPSESRSSSAPSESRPASASGCRATAAHFPSLCAW